MGGFACVLLESDAFIDPRVGLFRFQNQCRTNPRSSKVRPGIVHVRNKLSYLPNVSKDTTSSVHHGRTEIIIGMLQQVSLTIFASLRMLCDLASAKPMDFVARQDVQMPSPRALHFWKAPLDDFHSSNHRFGRGSSSFDGLLERSCLRQVCRIITLHYHIRQELNIEIHLARYSASAHLRTVQLVQSSSLSAQAQAIAQSLMPASLTLPLADHCLSRV